MRLILICILTLSFTCTVAHAQNKVKLRDRIKDAASKVDRQVNQSTSRSSSPSQSPTSTSVPASVERRDYYENPRQETKDAISYPTVMYKSDNALLRTIEIPRYKDKPRLGYPIDFFESLSGIDYGTSREGMTEKEDARILAHDATQKLKLELGKFYSLLQLSNIPLFCSNILKEPLFPRNHYSEEDRQLLSCQRTLLRIGHALVAPDALKRYFCEDIENCNQPVENLMNTKWGGFRASEFKRRSAYNQFMMDNYLSLVKLNKSVSRQTYLVNKGTLGEYNFAKGAFPFKQLTKVVDFYPKLVLSSADYEKYSEWTYLPMAEGDAESYIETHNNRTIYLVYTVEFQELETWNYRSSDFPPYDFTSTAVKVFSDSRLTNQLFEFQLLK